MKAWFVSDEEDMGVLIHAETRGQAKVTGGAIMNFDPLDYIYIHARRAKILDDKPFTLENVNEAQVFTGWGDSDGGLETDEGFFIHEGDWANFCECDICKAVNK